MMDAATFCETRSTSRELLRKNVRDVKLFNAICINLVLNYNTIQELKTSLVIL